VFVFWFFFGYQMFFDPNSSFILSPYKLGEIGVFGFSLLLSVTVLVVSCPCAVGLATPSAMMAGTGKAAEYGVLFKGAEAIEKASKLQTIVFDKTGTLTKGEPSVTDVVADRRWQMADSRWQMADSETVSAIRHQPLAKFCAWRPSPRRTASIPWGRPSCAARRIVT